MTNIHRKLSSKFRSQWIKIKFYRNEPVLKDARRLKNVRFCEATKEAIVRPIILDKESISCLGAQYAFGWRFDCKNELLEKCKDKLRIKKSILKSILSQTPYFKRPFNYIGLNTEGEPDLVMSYMPPLEIMNFVRIFNNKYGRNIDVSLNSMMSICSGIAVSTYLNGKINLSFGCNDSRRFADIRRENLAISIPKRLFGVFLD